MRLHSLQAVPVALPFRETYRTATGELNARSMIILRLHADSGHQGLGEAVPLSLRGGASLGQLAAELVACEAILVDTDLTPATAGDPQAIAAWLWSLRESCRAAGIAPQALSAIEIALHDLAGRISGFPVWRLLGATTVRGIECNATLDAGEPEQLASLAAVQRQAGFTTFKIKVGRGADLQRVAAVRDAIGGSARIRVDANTAWSVENAISIIGELDRYGLELVEQPCTTLPELAAVRTAVAPLPVVADESVASAPEAEQARASAACDAATLKLAKVGGPLEALRIAALIPSYLSSALDGPIGIAAAVHTAQALPRGGPTEKLAHGLATLGMFGEIYASGEGLQAPVLTPSREAGLGIELDESALAELRIP